MSARIATPKVITLTAVLLAVGVVIVGWCTFQDQRSVVQATSRVVLHPNIDEEDLEVGFSPAPIFLFSNGIESYSSLMYSENFLRRVISTHQLDWSTAELRQSMSITSPPDTTIIAITVRATDPDMAMRAAAGLAVEFSEVIGELESPTPIGGQVLGPVRAETVYPHSLLRNTVLTLIAVLTITGAAIALRGSFRNAQPGENSSDLKYEKESK